MVQEHAQKHKKNGGMPLISDTPPVVSRINGIKKRSLTFHAIF